MFLFYSALLRREQIKWLPFRVSLLPANSHFDIEPVRARIAVIILIESSILETASGVVGASVAGAELSPKLELNR